MIFNSFEFFLFFPIVTIIYFLLPHKYRWLHLLIASCVFYMFFIPVYILILFVTILIDYFAGIYIERSEGHKKKRYLIISIISTCLVLFFFKYFNFFAENINELAKLLGWRYSTQLLHIILPIGLSFHTFQSLSYVIEVYRGKQKAEKDFGIYALYVMFYPQLVAGPIERPQNILHQFYEKHTFNYRNATDGLKLMAWGLFKKVVIADRLAVFVNQAYNNPTGYSGIPLIVATIFFAFQIYCDFSGYSDIAIGAAQVMGFKLMDNFNRPYFSKSISEFWKRWHISLSTWFKDYLYIPLGGNRTVKWRWYYNLFITFLISGLWHGAAWTFIIWGALHGSYLVMAIITQKTRNKINKALGIKKESKLNRVLQVGSTFLLVCFAWIFFRANNTHDALYISSHLFSNIGSDIHTLLAGKDASAKHALVLKDLLINMSNPNQNLQAFITAILLILFMEFIHSIQRHSGIRHMLNNRPVLVRWSLYFAITFLIIYLGEFTNTKFIYFQF